MPANSIFDTTISVLGRVLDLRARKQEAVSANIANAETPGYARIEMDFEDALKDAAGEGGIVQEATHPRHIGGTGGNPAEGIRADYYRQRDGSGIGDENNVSLEREMVDLAQNQIRYEAAVRMISKKFNMLKTAIRGQA